MDETCVSRLLPLPVVPDLTNASISPIHPSYEPASGGLIQIISSRLAKQTFSIDDVRGWLNRLASDQKVSWSASEIIKMKPLPSIMAYVIVSLCLCLILSVTFCIISCVNCRPKASHQRGKRSIVRYVCIVLLVIVYLLGIGDAIYVAFRVNKSTTSIDQTITEINGEIYPKEVAGHLTYISNQFRRLNNYCSRPDSILINASKSMLDTTFKDILREKYYLPDLLARVAEADRNFTQLATIVHGDSSLPPLAKDLFNATEIEHRRMIAYLNSPLKELCNYNNATDTDIDKELLKALDGLHQVLTKLINTIEQDILQRITPWEDHLLLDKDLEAKIRYYLKVVGAIVFALIIALVVIPLVFFVWIVVSRLCCAKNSQSASSSWDRIPLEYPRRSSHSRAAASTTKLVQSSSQVSSSVGLCVMRIAFVGISIMSIILFVLTGVYYTADLSLQASCRTVHDDQPFLVSFVLDKFIKTDVSLNGTFDLNATVNQIIDACRERKHFSGVFLNKYWTDINQGIGDMMNTLNGQIYAQFRTSLVNIDLPRDIAQLTTLASLAGSPNITAEVREIINSMNAIQNTLDKINSSDSSLPPGLVQRTSDQFRNYAQQVFEFTIDACPLPLSTLYQTDTLICHQLANSLNGLWLSVFICLMLVLLGLCIFGLCIYKQPTGSVEEIHVSPDDSNYF